MPIPEPLIPIEGADVYDDPGDHLVPTPSYLADLVLAAKGILTPTRFTMWGGLTQVSSVLKRAAWIKWHPKPLFANIFVIIIGWPRFGGKSDIIDKYTDPLIRGYWKLIKDPIIRAEKYPRVFHSGATHKKIFEVLSRRTIKVPDGLERYFPGMRAFTKPYSDACLFMSELGTFLTQDQYNAGLIQKLNDFWTSKEIDDDSTITRGEIELKDIYVTMMGATTPDTIGDIIPAQAVSDGFISRTLFVKETDINRRWSRPRIIVEDEFNKLEERLAWIAENIRGEYDLSPEAQGFYDIAYHETINGVVNGQGKETAIKTRADIQMLKVALLIHAAKYDTSHIISSETFLQAKVIVSNTFPDMYQIVNAVGATFSTKQAEAVREYIVKRGDFVQRQVLLRRFSSDHGVGAIPVKLMEMVLDGFIQEGHLEIHGEDGKVIDRPQGKGREAYRWID